MMYKSYDHEMAARACAFWEGAFRLALASLAVSFVVMGYLVLNRPLHRDDLFWGDPSTHATIAFLCSIVAVVVSSMRSDTMKCRLKNFEDRTLEG